MIPRNSQAYLILRSQIQESCDFAYIVSQSIPCLKLQMSLVKKGQIAKLPNPDYFNNPNPVDMISKQIVNYKLELSKYILLSSFSYFESYFISAINELIEFHKGSENLKNYAKKKTLKRIQKQKGIYTNDITILSKVNSKHVDRKRKSTNNLVEKNFAFPTDLLSHYGVKALLDKIGNIRSVDIPKSMTEIFCLELSDNEIADFHKMRDIRNKVAHGDKVSLNVKIVFEMNTQLRNLALKFDQHLIEHFFITEEYIYRL